MKQAKWIWHPGSLELYHSMLLHNRRTSARRYKQGDASNRVGQARSVYYYPMWRVDGPVHNTMLKKTATIDKEETIELFSNTKDCAIIVDGISYNKNTKIKLNAGTHTVALHGFCAESFPAFYVTGNEFASDRTYKVDIRGKRYGQSAGESELYTDVNDKVETFKFSYKRIEPVSIEKINDGLLYDYGKEQFAKITLRSKALNEITLYIGESREEALDTDYSQLVVNAELKKGKCTTEAVAFRYIFVKNTKDLSISARLEYLPIKERGSFKCDSEFINKLWDTCAYTMLLNSREGFFDGIKRDRWIWSGDSYQSYIVNYYLGFNKDIVKRTIRALRGADPIESHINTITDYTFFWLISLYDYYMYTGDKEFLEDVYTDVLDVLEFVEGRLSEDGMFVRREGDWVFMDWSTFDSDGPMCAEQILLARAYEAVEACAIINKDNQLATRARERAEYIKGQVNKLYWNDKKGAFVDSYTSGRENVTRHANILAILFDYVSEERKQSIIKNVIYNKEITPITTPYFEFFELDAMCKIGDLKYMTDMLESYWGGMLRLGATTIWEEFDPKKSGIEHYEMYGGKYEKSLCHAWGASPIYLLGKYALGVRPTKAGYEEYIVAPNKMPFGNFEGKVPTPKGDVFVKISDTGCTILSQIDGGTLLLNDKCYPIEKNKKLQVKFEK